jgi:hypothetical protein
MDILTLLINLNAKGYTGGHKLIVYLFSQGKPMQEIIDICLDYLDPKYSVANLIHLD